MALSSGFRKEFCEIWKRSLSFSSASLRHCFWEKTDWEFSMRLNIFFLTNEVFAVDLCLPGDLGGELVVVEALENGALHLFPVELALQLGDVRDRVQELPVFVGHIILTPFLVLVGELGEVFVVLAFRLSARPLLDFLDDLFVFEPVFVVFYLTQDFVR